MKIVFITLLSIISFSLLAAPKTDVAKIEEQIRIKLESTLEVITPSKDYIIDVQIQKKKLEPIQKNTNSIRLTDEAKETQEDYLLFNKFGLEAPIFEEVKEEKQQTTDLKSINVSVFLDKSLPETTVSSIKEVMAKINFNLEVKPKLDIITLSLKAPEIPKEKEELQPEKPLSLREILRLASESSASLGIIIGSMILALVGFTVTGKATNIVNSKADEVIKSNKELTQAQMDAQEAFQNAIAGVTPDDEKESDADSSSGGGSGGSGGEGAAGEGGGGAAGELGLGDTNLNLVTGEELKEAIEVSVDRFVTFFKKNKNDAGAMIKKWLKLEPENYDSALVLLAQELKAEVLVEIFSTLSMDDRKDWKNVILKVGANINKALACQFIDEQILEDIIIPTNLIDEQTKNLLYGVDPKTCAEIIQNTPDLGPLLFNTLVTKYIVKMIPYLPEDMVSPLTLNSAKAEPDELKKQADKLKMKLQAYQDTGPDSPFRDKIIEILPYVSLENENHFFVAYAENASRARMMDLLRAFIPGSAIPKLPDNVLEKILPKVPKNNLLSVIAISEEETANRLLEMVAPGGSKKREMWDLDLQSVKDDEIKMARLNREKDDIIASNYELIRKLIKVDPTLVEECEPLLEEVCNQYKEADAQEETSEAA